MEKLFNYYTCYGTFSAGKKNKTTSCARNEESARRLRWTRQTDTEPINGAFVANVWDKTSKRITKKLDSGFLGKRDGGMTGKVTKESSGGNGYVLYLDKVGVTSTYALVKTN